MAKMPLFWIYIRETSLLSHRSLIHLKLLLMTSLPFREVCEIRRESAGVVRVIVVVIATRIDGADIVVVIVIRRTQQPDGSRLRNL